MECIRIGSRKSRLALWQAEKVAEKIRALGYETQIIPIESQGDQNQKQPLYTMGITGVFTKNLDLALLNDTIDVGVHSLKDVPTTLPNGIILSATLARDYPEDVLIRNKAAKNKPLDKLSIATSSLRRRAFWKNQFPNTAFTDIRGNVETRIRKIEEGLADATLLSLAGLKRMNVEVAYETLPFLLQAPSQGVVCCTSKEDNPQLLDLLSQINHSDTMQCVDVERGFLRRLEGGCTAPIGAKATLFDNKIYFEGRLVDLSGAQRIDLIEEAAWQKNLGAIFADKVLQQGGAKIMAEIKAQL